MAALFGHGFLHKAQRGHAKQWVRVRYNNVIGNLELWGP